MIAARAAGPSIVFTALLVGLTAGAQAQSPRTDFARGAEIRANGDGGIVRIVLPEDVYATVTRADLADLRVFNRAGEAVPHALRHSPLRPASEAEPINVPLFPMYRLPSSDSLLTQVTVGPGGAVLQVRNRPPTDAVVVSYLIDASMLDAPLAQLSLQWESQAGATFLARIDVEASDDLNAWRTVVPSAAVAQLRYGQHELMQRDIVLPAGVRARYVRLSWPKELAGITLKAVGVRPRGTSPSQEITWSVRTGRATGAPGVAAEYDAGGRLPVEHVDVEFADRADVASVTILSRPDASAEWRQLQTGVFYSLLEAGEQIRSGPARIAPTSNRYWRLETTREGGWTADRLPRLKLGWYPHELLFLTTGEGPYTLAYGSVRAGAAEAPIETLLANLGDVDAPDRTTQGAVGTPRDLGGLQALTPRRPWRQIALWAVLLAAVAALAGMALRASRDMSRA